jgi:hypothetical protein
VGGGGGGGEGRRERSKTGRLLVQQLQLKHTQDLVVNREVQQDLLGEDWEEGIVWDAADAERQQQQQKAPVIWDLNDQHMIFWTNQAGAFETASALVHANPIQVSVRG